MGSGAGVLRGGRPRLLFQCADLRTAWCNGLVVYENGTVQSIDNNEEGTEDMDIEAVDSDDVEIDSDYQVDSDPEAEAEAVAALNVYWIARDYDRN